jgi:hypothetical protein
MMLRWKNCCRAVLDRLSYDLIKVFVTRCLVTYADAEDMNKGSRGIWYEMGCRV